jgi:UV DNA damage endonuclease
MRLGFAVKVLGAPGLPSHDSRRWQNQPHLSVSLAYLRDIFLYLESRSIRFYRLAGQLAPYLTHPELPAFHRQLDECATELAAVGDLARQQRLRLTMHPGFFVQLNSPEPPLLARSIADLESSAALLDGMGIGREGVIVVHVGGVHDNREAGRARFVRGWEQIPASVQARVVLEHDDRRYSLSDALWIHRRTGVPVVFDSLHHRCLNPENIPSIDGLRLALSTWPGDVRPKIHISSPRTEIRYLRRPDGVRMQAPLLNQHSDFLDLAPL